MSELKEEEVMRQLLDKTMYRTINGDKLIRIWFKEKVAQAKLEGKAELIRKYEKDVCPIPINQRTLDNHFWYKWVKFKVKQLKPAGGEDDKEK